MKNILYIHGLNSSKESYTGTTLKEHFPQFNWILETFDLLKIEETIHQISQILKEEHIDTIVSSSLGCIYNLYIKQVGIEHSLHPNKILINPCCLPSKELLHLTEVPPLALEYCKAVEANIYEHMDENTPENLFGIFSLNDELLHYHDFFVEKYGNGEKESPSNCIRVDGGHAHLDVNVLQDGFLKAIAYFDGMEQKCGPQNHVGHRVSHWADPSKPVGKPSPNGPKPILYFDMDGVLVDFESGKARLDKFQMIEYHRHYDEVPHIFSWMKPIEGSIEAFKELSNYYDTYILSTATWKNPTAWSDKLEWIHKYFGEASNTPVYKHLILSHHKNLNIGDFLIDDRPNKCGADLFTGTLIPFGPKHGRFRDWDSVLRYLL